MSSTGIRDGHFLPPRPAGSPAPVVRAEEALRGRAEARARPAGFQGRGQAHAPGRPRGRWRQLWEVVHGALWHLARTVMFFPRLVGRGLVKASAWLSASGARTPGPVAAYRGAHAEVVAEGDRTRPLRGAAGVRPRHGPQDVGGAPAEVPIEAEPQWHDALHRLEAERRWHDAPAREATPGRFPRLELFIHPRAQHVHRLQRFNLPPRPFPPPRAPWAGPIDVFLPGFDQAGRRPPEPPSPAAQARVAALRRQDPQQAYRAVVEGRIRLAALVGPDGPYDAEQVCEHLRRGLAPAPLVADLLQVSQVARHFALTLGSLRSPVARGYSRKSLGILAQLPPQLLWGLARGRMPQTLAMPALLQGLDVETLVAHANRGWLALPADLRYASPAAVLRLVHDNLLPALPQPQRFANVDAGGLSRELDSTLPWHEVKALLAVLSGRQGVAFPPGVGAWRRREANPLVFANVLAGRVRYATAAAQLPPLSLTEMAKLVAANNGSWVDWFVRHNYSDATLREAVNFQVIEPYYLRLGGPNVVRATAAMLRSGQINAAQAAAAMAPFWREGEELGPHAVAWCREQNSLRALMHGVELPVALVIGTVRQLPPPLAAAEQRRNAAYLALCVASWLERGQPPAAPARPAEAAGPTRPCTACLDDVPEAELVDLAGCAHPPAFDKGCFLRGLQAGAGGSHRCPEPACARPLGLADAVQLELPYSRRLAFASRAAQDALQRETDWAGCRTAGCHGGRYELVATQLPMTCACCGVTAAPRRGQVANYAQLDAAGRAQVAQLVRDMALGPETGGTRPIRACYHCGLLTEHRDACMHLVCSANLGGCGRDWNFVDGVQQRSQANLEPARYVPQAGWLLDMGLYEGLQPGQHNVPVLTVVRRNLLRLQREAAAG